MKHSYAQANGIKIHYVEQGTGKLVILLHGFPEFWYGWKNQIPELAKKYRVVAPDMRGYNLSDKPKKVSDYTMEILAKDIADLITALGEKEALLVGHDWGAAVAWSVAAWYPEKVTKLAILNVPHPAKMKQAFEGFNLQQWKKSWYIFFFQLPLFPEKIVGTEKFFRQTFSKMGINKNAFSKYDIDQYVEAYKQPGAIKSTIAYYRAAFRSIFSAKSLPKINAPVLMLWGEQDTALGKELTYNTQQYCQGDFEIFYDATSGHFVQHDNPKWVNEKLVAFFEK